MFDKLIAGVFGKEKLEHMRSTVQYEDAKVARRRILVSWRTSALNELRFIYPDAIFLIGDSCDRFMGFSSKQRTFIIGRFGDYFFPKLRDLPRDSPSALKAQAANDFHLSAELFKKYPLRQGGTGSPAKPEEFLFPNQQIFHIRTEELGTKGFVYYTFTSDFIVGAELKKDGSVIANANEFDEKSPGYFSACLFNAMTAGRLVESRSLIQFSVFQFEPGDEIGFERKFTIEIPYLLRTTPDRTIDLTPLQELTQFIAETEFLFSNSQYDLSEKYRPSTKL